MTLPKISFCTTCMGRLNHLKETLAKNISDNMDYIHRGGGVEFVVVNYGADLELEKWIREIYSHHIEQGLIRYVSVPDKEHFHNAHAKNIAHRCATGDILCSLDADNYTGAGFASFIQDHFKDSRRPMRRNKVAKFFLNEPPSYEGDAGRIVVHKDDFKLLRGYSEDYLGWGGEDIDFATRLIRLYWAVPKHIPFKYLECITHSNDLRIAKYDSDSQRKSRMALESFTQKSVVIIIYYYFLRRARDFRTIASNVLDCNLRGYGKASVIVNFEEKFDLM